MVMNCAGNAVTAITQTSFAHAARNLDTREVMRMVINECVAVARASGIRLPEVDWTEKGLKNEETLGEAVLAKLIEESSAKRRGAGSAV